ncbi:hypothetical protein LCGC14_1672030, partial [marine sediment metagenome]
GKTVNDLKAAINMQVNKLKQTRISQAELERVKSQVMADDVYQKDSVFYQAMQIGMLETIGVDWRIGDEYVANIKAVTPEQIQSVAKKYFVDDTLSVGELVPLPMYGQPSMALSGANNVH